MQLPFLLLGCSVRERTPLLLLQQEFDNAFLFLSLPAVAYAVCAVAATDGGAGKADTVDWHPNSSNKMLALPGLLCYYPGCVYQSWLALQLFGRFMSFPPQAPRMPADPRSPALELCTASKCVAEQFSAEPSNHGCDRGGHKGHVSAAVGRR